MTELNAAPPPRSHADRLFGDAQGIRPAGATNAATTVLTPDAKANTLFGQTSGQSANGEARAPWSDNVTERELFGGDYEPPAREMFSPEVALRPTLHARHPDVMTVLQLGEKERIERHRDFVAAIRESGLDAATTGAALYNLKTDADIASAHGRAVDDGAPTPLVEHYLSTLLAQLGPQRGERLVGAVNAYIEAHPKLARVWHTPGLQSRPGFAKVLEQVTDHVRRTERI